MTRLLLPVALSLLALPLACAIARGDQFTIDLEVKTPTATKTAHAEAAGLALAPKARGAVEAVHGKPFSVKFTVTSTAPKETVKDVLVHCFVVKEAKQGQATVPRLDKGVAAESALTMDFKPGDKADGELSVQIDAPGIYLLRVETIGAAAAADGHEYFAALDLIVK